MNHALDIVKDPTIDWRQKKLQLALYAQNTVPYVAIGSEAEQYLATGILDDLGEGNAPCSPRYTLPDYARFLKNGSTFLQLEPPQTLFDAIQNLQILYHYVPTVTGFPVFLGKIDQLLEPFSATVDEQTCTHLLRSFLNYVDRVFPDGFVHMDIGPEETRIGRLILEIEQKRQRAVPNLSLLVNAKTPDQFLKLGVQTALCTGKPYFANDTEIEKSLGGNYGIASCYNSLRIGGGSFTLVRLNLAKAAKLATSYEDFLNRILPSVVDAQCEIINARARFIVENVGFFKSSFLSKEGLLQLNQFTSMAGIYGLYECVEQFSDGLHMGHDQRANALAQEILQRTADCVEHVDGAYCGGTGGRIGFHAQSLISTDVGYTAGVRIKIGEEPALFDQIRLEGKLNKPFNTGVSDIYVFDRTAKQNPEGVMTIVKGALKHGIKMFALNSSDSELVRVTGYLVKKSDMERYNNGEPVLEDTVQLGAESAANQGILNRKERTLV